jgi:hypothetical protein
VLPPPARALPSLLTAIRLTEQDERRATATGSHVTHSWTIRGFISILHQIFRFAGVAKDPQSNFQHKPIKPIK